MSWRGGEEEDGVGKVGSRGRKGVVSKESINFTGLSENQPEAEILPLDFPFTCAAEVTPACSLLSVGVVGILGPFQLHLQAFHANLEAIHGLDSSLCTGWVVKAHKTKTLALVGGTIHEHL